MCENANYRALLREHKSEQPCWRAIGQGLVTLNVHKPNSPDAPSSVICPEDPFMPFKSVHNGTCMSLSLSVVVVGVLRDLSVYHLGTEEGSVRMHAAF